MTPVRYGQDILWPIHIGAAGLYELTFEAEPVVGSPSRWFVRLETTSGDELTWTRTLEPVDLSRGRRRVRFLFNVDRPVGPARVRVKSEMGQALSVARASFRRAASVPDAPARGDRARQRVGRVNEGPRGLQPAALSRPRMAPDVPARSAPGTGTAVEAPPLTRSPLIHRKDLPGGISLYEVPGAAELVYWATGATPVTDLLDTVEQLQVGSPTSDHPPETLVQYPAKDDSEAAETTRRWAEARLNDPGDDATLRCDRRAGHDLRIEAHCSTGGLLVFNESYDPGWRATIDGRPVSVLRVNAVCQGVVVPAGPHAVRFAYRPPGLAVGAAASVSALIVLAAAFLATAIRRPT